MKSLIVVSLFGGSVLLGLPAGAQQMPSPYAPPQQLQQMPPPDTQVDGMALPTGEEMAVPPGADSPQEYDPNWQNHPDSPNSPNAVDYPPADLGPDNEIAQSYDDGYDAQAYTQFQTALAPYGGWDYDSSYGYVWSPNVSVVGAGFSPYATCGHWALTEYGWTWVSDWSWGWAPFHYGRWITRAGRWSWVPGSMWGPAWVSWRSGGGYVGWSPLPPRGMRLAGGYGAGSPWRFAPAASLGAGRPIFVSPRHLPGIFARTTVVSNDRLLTHGGWSVHVNAGPTRGIVARPVSLSRVAPAALPRVAVYPHPGVSLNARPWIHPAEARGNLLTEGWHAAGPASQPHTVGRAPAFGSNPAARAEVRGPSATWSQRPTSAYGAAGYGHPYNSGWSAPATRTSSAPAMRPTYGAPSGYSGQNAYRAPMNAYHAPAAMPAYRAPAPASAYHAPAPAYHVPAPSYAPAPRSFAPPSAPPSGGGFGHFGSAASAGSHFGASGAGHFGGFGSGGRRR
jgi:hypothetical protein